MEVVVIQMVVIQVKGTANTGGGSGAAMNGHTGQEQVDLV